MRQFVHCLYCSCSACTTLTCTILDRTKFFMLSIWVVTGPKRITCRFFQGSHARMLCKRKKKRPVGGASGKPYGFPLWSRLLDRPTPCDHITEDKTLTKQAKPNLSDRPKRGPYNSQKQKRQADPFRLWFRCAQRPVLVGRKGDCFGGLMPA